MARDHVPGVQLQQPGSTGAPQLVTHRVAQPNHDHALVACDLHGQCANRAIACRQFRNECLPAQGCSGNPHHQVQRTGCHLDDRHVLGGTGPGEPQPENAVLLRHREWSLRMRRCRGLRKSPCRRKHKNGGNRRRC